MNVSACLVTRGDVDLNPILDSFAQAHCFKDVAIWDNSKRDDLAVYGRYAAIAETSGDLIFTQDDDCVLPASSIKHLTTLLPVAGDQFLVANMPQPFRHDFYSDHALVGFGACFHRDLPWLAFEQLDISEAGGFGEWFRRTCDVVFTALTPRVLVDVPYENLPWASDDSRMWKQNGHIEERTRMLELVRQVRSA